MSEPKIQLPDFLIAELYKGTLVDLDTFNKKAAQPVVEEQQEKPQAPFQSNEKIKFLGENGKGVVIIVEEPEAVFLMEDNLTFLTNILKACQLNLTDIAIINLATGRVVYEEIKEQLQAHYILLFDVEPSAIKLPFLIPAFQVQQYDGCTVMVAPPLTALNKPGQDSKLLKTKLWLSLKQVFNIG